MDYQPSLPFKSSSIDTSIQDRLIKVRRKKILWVKYIRKFQREFMINHSDEVICYKSFYPELCGFKREKVTKMNFMDIVGTRKGCCTDSFHKIKKQKEEEGKVSFIDPQKCFSIIFERKQAQQTLDLVCEDTDTRDRWYQSVRKIISEVNEKKDHNYQEQFLRNLFKSADKNHSGVLDPTEFAEVMRKINLDIKESDIEDIFERADTNGSMGVDEEEFKEIYNSNLSRPEILAIFNNLKHKKGIPINQLHKFLVESQGTTIDVKECKNIILQ